MDTDLGFLIVQIKQLSDRLFNKMLSERGLASFNGAQGRILIVLWNKGCQSIHELSLATTLAPTSLTAMLDRLEKKGLITRKKSPKDRRKMLIAASEDSLKLKAEYLAIETTINGYFLSGFTSEETTHLLQDLTHLRQNILTKGKL